MDQIENAAFPHYTYPILSAHHQDIVHFTSGKSGGHSSAPYGRFNMSFTVGEDAEIVQKNRELICKTFNTPVDQLVFGRQEHLDRVLVIGEEFFDLSEEEQRDQLKATDGLITATPKTMVCILTADCGGILLFDPVNKVVGAVHAGWRGVHQKIILKAIQLMKHEFGTQPDQLKAVISPCIGVDNYEVGEEVAGYFEEIFPDSSDIIDYTYPKAHVDITMANQKIMLDAGMQIQNIEAAATCTFEHHDRFYSARRGDKGRFCSGIMLR